MDDLVESGRAFQSLMRKGRKIGEGGCSTGDWLKIIWQEY